MSITMQLPRVQTAKIWESAGADKSEAAKKLQTLFDAGKTGLYETEKNALEAQGFQFRVTDGKIYQITDEGRTMQVPIRFQVKGGTMTWYFVAPKDETHQDFRDEVYGSAAIGHKATPNTCEKYWRGTNSLHVKKMHTRESESGLNHNHYRMKEGFDATPLAVYQHLMGFVDAQRELNLVDDLGREKYLTEEEAIQLADQYTIHWTKITHVGDKTSLLYKDKLIELPKRDVSILSDYKRLQEEKLSLEDKKEWEENKHKEEPCVAISNWSSLSTKQRLEAISTGMRGLGSELAHTRQVEGSKYATITTVVPMSDQVAIPK